jgi:hypothetical protein
VEHEYHEAEVELGHHDYHSLVALEGLEDLFQIGVQVAEGDHEDANGSDAPDSIGSL